MAKYSRLASVEERRNVRKAAIFVLLTIAAVILLFFIGIPALGKFAGFVSDLAKSDKPIASQDKTPPAPPRFNSFPDFTNQEGVVISGDTESGATVKLTFNGSGEEALADRDGHFSFNLKHQPRRGKQTWEEYLTEIQPTLAFTFKKSPDLTIDSPAPGAQFFGTKQRQVTIQGTSESGVGITVNERILSVDDMGKFQYTTTLNDGENKFLFKATDSAGNTTESELVLNFSS
ncbi:MAG: Polymorphic outer membrane protein [Candidatus Woesebacteria bacterium GW2011_GWB1_45_5]|uniref:Polymorphic outer membrane protein n=1 Tax=Candidatus Woesebacteria bacterium GW2011_GWB1_45_5 TaxID=1618581 RepID=A0A0G1QJY1_9BACT|nr:MAG: Polymorphic outer membrane protein [Candidatus Woesebacteria bacterium GW2011_GWB1_45_5]